MKKKKEVTDSRSEKKVKSFRFYKFLAITILVVFLLGGFILFENDITVENLRYLIKYLDFSSSGAFSEESVIYYNADSGNDFQVFRGDLVLANAGGVTLFDRRGSAVMTDSYNMANPTCVCGEKYLAIYDLGGHEVRIYNSFSLLYEKSFDYTVQAVSINSDGAFCVVTSEKNYRSAVFVFDKEFEETYRWLSADKFAVKAYLSDRGELTITSVHAENGDLVSDLVELKVGDKKAGPTFSMKDELPLDHFSDRKGTVLITDQNLRFIRAGKEEKNISFPEDSLKKFSLGEKLSVVLQDELSVGVNYRLRVFDRKGEEVSSEKFSVSIRALEVLDDRVYVLTHTDLYVMEAGEKTKIYPLNGDFLDLGVFSRDCVVLCSDTEAKIRILD